MRARDEILWPGRNPPGLLKRHTVDRSAPVWARPGGSRVGRLLVPGRGQPEEEYAMNTRQPGKAPGTGLPA
jgi:hypothetical protein